MQNKQKERPGRPEDCADQEDRRIRKTEGSGRQKDQEDRKIRKTEGSGRQKDQKIGQIGRSEDSKTEGSEDRQKGRHR